MGRTGWNRLVMVSGPYKELITGGAWARDADDERETPEAAGLTRDRGWPLPYEQIGANAEPEREVFNQREYELTVGADRLRSNRRASVGCCR